MHVSSEVSRKWSEPGREAVCELQAYRYPTNVQDDYNAKCS